LSDHFENIGVVCDKFQVIQNGVEACEQVRMTDSRAEARKAWPVEADSADVAQQPGELDEKGSPEVGVLFRGMV
jgi:hypothetical protein